MMPTYADWCHIGKTGRYKSVGYCASFELLDRPPLRNTSKKVFQSVHHKLVKTVPRVHQPAVGLIGFSAVQMRHWGEKNCFNTALQLLVWTLINDSPDIWCKTDNIPIGTRSTNTPPNGNNVIEANQNDNNWRRGYWGAHERHICEELQVLQAGKHVCINSIPMKASATVGLDTSSYSKKHLFKVVQSKSLNCCFLQ